MKWAVLLLVLLLGTGFADPQQPVPEGELQAGKPVHDRDFGVSTRQFGLERQIEMYQWRASGDRYQPVWNGARIDSSQFAKGYQNPPSVPLESRRWWAEGATLDGKPIDPAVLRALGQWQRFRPNFSRLPSNLAASFQPEGDGLGSSENPLAPQVGDLRVYWRELVMPDWAGKLQLRDGVWTLTPQATAAASTQTPLLIQLPVPPALPVREVWPWLVVAGLFIVGLWSRVRRRRHDV